MQKKTSVIKKLYYPLIRRTSWVLCESIATQNTQSGQTLVRIHFNVFGCYCVCLLLSVFVYFEFISGDFVFQFCYCLYYITAFPTKLIYYFVRCHLCISLSSMYYRIFVGNEGIRGRLARKRGEDWRLTGTKLKN